MVSRAFADFKLSNNVTSIKKHMSTPIGRFIKNLKVFLFNIFLGSICIQEKFQEGAINLCSDMCKS